MIGWSCIRKRPKDKERANSIFSSCAPSKFSKSCNHDIYCDQVFYDFPGLNTKCGSGVVPPASPQIAMKILPKHDDNERRSDYLLMLESQMRVLHPNNPSDYVSVELPRRKSENDACAMKRVAKNNNKNKRKSLNLPSTKNRSDSHNSMTYKSSKNRSDSHHSTSSTPQNNNDGSRNHLDVPERSISINRKTANTYREKQDNENAVQNQGNNVPAIFVEYA